MYKYSMTQWIVGNEDIELSIKRLKKYGYDGIELAGEPDQIDRERVKRLLSYYDLECTSICGIFSEDRDLTSGDEEEKNKAVSYIRKCVDLAVEVGAACLIVVPSPVGRTSVPKGCNIKDMWENAVKNISEAADYAQEKGVCLVIEAVNRYETYLVNTIGKAYKMVKEIDHPAVGIMADLFHMSLEESSIPDCIHQISDKLKHVHIADNTREAAGFGNTNFKEIVFALKNVGYKGALTMEFMPRVADPYASRDVETQSDLMDIYAEQSILHMKAVEKVVNFNLKNKI